jgi:hypothetical protein
MLRRAEQHGVAPIVWQRESRGAGATPTEAPAGPASSADGSGCAAAGDLVALSHGPAEASSHVETTMTQLVQELVIQAQVSATVAPWGACSKLLLFLAYCFMILNLLLLCHEKHLMSLFAWTQHALQLRCTILLLFPDA